MSCTDVMYQPYASYISYAQRHSVATSGSSAYMDSFKKLGFQKMADHLDMGSYPSHAGLGLSSLNAATTGGGGGSLTNSLSGSPPIQPSLPTQTAATTAAASSPQQQQQLNQHHHSHHSHHTSTQHHHHSHHHSATATSQQQQHHHHHQAVAATTTSSSSSSSTKQEILEDDDDDKDTPPQPRDTQYLTANCVLLTYFSGDIASHVDDHFSRALSQTTYTGSTDSHNNGSGKNTTTWSSSNKGGLPMSQRNFPPSFWNSHYQPPASVPSSLSSTFDPYSTYPMASSLHGHMPGLSYHHAHHQDPWARAAAAAYPLSTSQTSYPLHDYTSSYGSMSSTSRFNPQFSSYLPSKLGGLASQYDIKPHTATPSAAAGSAEAAAAAAAGAWSSRYDPFSASSSITGSSHHQDAYSLAYPGALSGAC